MNQGPSFKYLFVIAAILIIVFFLRDEQGSLDTYAYAIRRYFTYRGLA